MWGRKCNKNVSRKEFIISRRNYLMIVLSCGERFQATTGAMKNWSLWKIEKVFSTLQAVDSRDTRARWENVHIFYWSTFSLLFLYYKQCQTTTEFIIFMWTSSRCTALVWKISGFLFSHRLWLVEVLLTILWRKGFMILSDLLHHCHWNNFLGRDMKRGGKVDNKHLCWGGKSPAFIRGSIIEGWSD